MKIRIRNAVREDLPAVVGLLRHLDVGEDKDLSIRRARAIFERTRRYPLYRIYVAVAPDRSIVGTFALLIIDGLAHGGAPHGLVEDVVVNPQWRGRGIGNRMMRYAMQRCRAAGCYKMALSSHLSRSGTHGFYESLGFAKHGYSFLAR